MNLSKFFNWNQPTPGTGACLDTRPPEEKAKDYSSVEAYASANPVNWVEKPESAWRTFPVQNQNGSGSCVAQTMKKLLLVMLWLKDKTIARFSATHIYQRRSNKPEGGMIGVEAFDIAMKGVTLEELVPSENMTDAQMDSAVIDNYKEKVGTVFTIGGHVGIPLKDIDLVASVIQTTGKAVMTWFYFSSEEWSSKVPTIKTAFSGEGDPRALRHSVATVDFTLYNGQKALIIEDSAWFGGINRRIITEDFFKQRNFFTRYPMNFTFAPETIPNRPKYTFTKNLEFIPLDTKGNISDLVKNEAQKADVVALQEILKFEGLLPTNIESTGYYGAITAKALLAFQKKYTISPDAELETLQGKTCGPKTRSKLNTIYG